MKPRDYIIIILVCYSYITTAWLINTNLKIRDLTTELDGIERFDSVVLYDYTKSEDDLIEIYNSMVLETDTVKYSSGVAYIDTVPMLVLYDTINNKQYGFPIILEDKKISK